ncbi:MAG: glycosyltransferase family 2 protein [Streptococcaceae bacterium]|jgi:glycosyltransferase involved in cell wall biosynthesis|nr:glycosyltransferase family 2 protein [Streptococcaceae bacterium]
MKLSIVIPTYNRQGTIVRSINSVLKQEGMPSDFELIIIDDCSTDDTVRVVQEIGNPNIMLFKLEKNSGANIARNVGFEKSQGDIIAFQDSDDVWLQGKLKRQLEILRDGYDIVGSSLMQFKKEKDFSNLKIGREGIEISPDRLFPVNIVSTQTLVFRRKVMEELMFDPIYSNLEDWDFAIRASQNFKFFYLLSPTCLRYLSKNSITRNHKDTAESYSILYKKFNNIINNFDDKSKKANFLVDFAVQCQASGLPSWNLKKEALKTSINLRVIGSFFLTKKIINFIAKRWKFN